MGRIQSTLFRILCLVAANSVSGQTVTVPYDQCQGGTGGNGAAGNCMTFDISGENCCFDQVWCTRTDGEPELTDEGNPVLQWSKGICHACPAGACTGSEPNGPDGVECQKQLSVDYTGQKNHNITGKIEGQSWIVGIKAGLDTAVGGSFQISCTAQETITVSPDPCEWQLVSLSIKAWEGREAKMTHHWKGNWTFRDCDGMPGTCTDRNTAQTYTTDCESDTSTISANVCKNISNAGVSRIGQCPPGPPDPEEL